jgi:hypothetical protein
MPFMGAHPISPFQGVVYWGGAPREPSSIHSPGWAQDDSPGRQPWGPATPMPFVGAHPISPFQGVVYWGGAPRAASSIHSPGGAQDDSPGLAPWGPATPMPFVGAHPISPFQGVVYWGGVGFPGRCPGLSDSAPPGLHAIGSAYSVPIHWRLSRPLPFVSRPLVAQSGFVSKPADHACLHPSPCID